MSPLPARVDAVAFDYGNTLIEFGPRQVDLVQRRLREALAAFGPVDDERLREVRSRQMATPYEDGNRENDERAVCAELLREVVGVTATTSRLDDLVRVRYEAFLEAVTPPPGVADLLDRLASRYRLALVSNYPCGRGIRDSLARIGLAGHFTTVVVSGDLGLAKPHAAPFRRMLAGMGVAPEHCVHVGDNWLADVQGAKALGLGAVWTTQYAPYRRIEPQPGDHQPDLSIEHLDELGPALLP